MNREWAKKLHDIFPVARNTAFFDIAYENCGSDLAKESALLYFRDKCGVYPNMEKAGGAGKGAVIEVVADTRQKIARFLNAESSKNIIFTANTCQAVSLALKGLRLRKGENVVVGDIEHVSVLMPCLKLREDGVGCRVAKSRDGLTLTPEDLLAAVNEETRVVAVSLVQSCSGYRIDLRRLVVECHKRGILVITDAIQALGVSCVDVQELGVDALAASGYKGMLGIEGSGFLYCSSAMLAQLEPPFSCVSAAVSFDRNTQSVCIKDPLDGRKMEAGTLPFESIYALRTGLEQLLSIGMEEVAAHVRNCVALIYEKAQELGYSFLLPCDPDIICNSLLLIEKQPEKLVSFCEEHGVYFSRGKDDFVRISVAPFTIQADIVHLIDVLTEWKEKEEKV